MISYSPEDFLCTANGCPAFINGRFLFRDSDHWRRNLDKETLEQLAVVLKLDALFEGLPEDQGSAAIERAPHTSVDAAPAAR